jgi:hypothetical protein
MYTKAFQGILGEIIEKTFGGLRFNLLGPDKVSKSILFTLDSKRFDPQSTVAGAYVQANTQHTHDPKAIDKKTIARLVDVTEDYIDKLEQTSIADFGRIVSQYAAELDSKAKMTGASDRDVALSEDGIKLISQMKRELREQKVKIDKAAGVIAEVARHDSYNFGAMDGILNAAKKMGIDDPTVFKHVMSDERTCKYCMKLWMQLDGVTPKLYKMSELSATPGNDYKNPKPSVAVTHPNCRCVLVPLMNGFAHEDGKTVYKGTDPETGQPYDAYAKQKSGK